MIHKLAVAKPEPEPHTAELLRLLATHNPSIVSAEGDFQNQVDVLLVGANDHIDKHLDKRRQQSVNPLRFFPIPNKNNDVAAVAVTRPDPSLTF